MSLPQYSPDGRWLWDGQQWLPAPPSSPEPLALRAAPPRQRGYAAEIGTRFAVSFLLSVAFFLVIWIGSLLF